MTPSRNRVYTDRHRRARVAARKLVEQHFDIARARACGASGQDYTNELALFVVGLVDLSADPIKSHTRIRLLATNDAQRMARRMLIRHGLIP